MAEGKLSSPGTWSSSRWPPRNAGQESCFVKDGDSVCVLLTDVTDLGTTDPATGQALWFGSPGNRWASQDHPSPPPPGGQVESLTAHQEALMFPRYRHTPTFDTNRKRSCSICGQPVYSLAGIHPQCAIRLPEAQHSGTETSAAGVEALPRSGNPGNCRLAGPSRRIATRRCLPQPSLERPESPRTPARPARPPRPGSRARRAFGPGAVLRTPHGSFARPGPVESGLERRIPSRCRDMLGERPWE